MAGKFFKKLAV